MWWRCLYNLLLLKTVYIPGSNKYQNNMAVNPFLLLWCHSSYYFFTLRYKRYLIVAKLVLIVSSHFSVFQFCARAFPSFVIHTGRLDGSNRQPEYWHRGSRTRTPITHGFILQWSKLIPIITSGMCLWNWNSTTSKNYSHTWPYLTVI